ncbi:unnamed protein product [Rhizoctonia solani]|uniref:Transcription factor BYE1 n=1 Tax=Rhizoctonia solani TaxID=456999 RepID=A0A8H3DDF6_9AGAM|nr:unnamed protein product [Rhizoctonia solani]
MTSVMSTRARRRSTTTRPGTKGSTTRRRSGRVHLGEQEDICRCGNMEVGIPMLRCGECHGWYHFRCADLTERDAEELAYYICPPCAVSTGKKSREQWELDDTELAALPRARDHEQTPSQSSDDEAGSEDDFVGDPEKAILVEDPPSDHSDEGIAARIHRRARKRKSISKQIEISVKRHKPIESMVLGSPPTSADDPIRKSCLEILIKLLTPIFSERLPDEPEPAAQAVVAEQFATELEACIFGIYGDLTDFEGKMPGNKYKERVRMLNFNLGKKDRKELRQSIRVGRISPDELSRMSSIDLANSQAQQEAHKLAEEAMNHSILQARTAPLRKITHKGEQVIEQSQEEENWRMQEEEAARERERDLQRSRSNTIGSVTDGDKPRIRPHSDSFAGGREKEAISTHSIQPLEKAFDPASAVFNVDFDGDGPTLHQHGPPTPPGLSGEPVASTQNVLGEGLQMASPTSTSVSQLAQNFSLDGIFGSSEPVASMWNDIRESEGSVSPHSHMGDDAVAPPDDADFDAFITVDEDEVPRTTTPKEEPVSSVVAGPLSQESTHSRVDIRTIWQAHVGMPSMNDPSRMIQFQSEFKQVAGAPFHDIEANRKSLFPVSLFEIIGRVPTSQAVSYLVSMRLNPTKELFACVLVPNEDDKAAYLELHRILIGKDRYGLVFPWGQDPPLSAPGKELYIAPLLPDHPIPEYLQLLDNVNIPAKRDGPILCGIFVLGKGRVTTLDAKDIPHPTPPPPASSVPPPASIPAISVTPANSLETPPVLPSVGSTLANLSENSLATLSKDLANLTPGQLELVRSLLIQQPTPVVTPPVLPLAPIPPPPPAAIPLQPVSSRRLSHPVPGPPGAFQSPAPPAGRSPTHTPGPLRWDRPRPAYPDHGWEPGPGPTRYGRDEYSHDDFGRDELRRDDFRRDDFRRDDFGHDDFGPDDFGHDDFGHNELPRGDFRRDEFRRDDFRREDFMREDFGREPPRDEWSPYGRHDPRDDRSIYRGRGGGPSRYRGRGRGGPPARW